MMRIFQESLRCWRPPSVGGCAQPIGFPASHSASDGLPAGRDRSRERHDLLRRVRRERGDLPRQPAHRRGGNPRSRASREGRDRHRARQPKSALGRRRRNGQGVRLRRRDRSADPDVHLRDVGHVHQRRRRDAHRRDLHRFAQGRPLPRPDRGGRRFGRCADAPARPAISRLRAASTSTESMRPRNGKTLDRGPVQHREALPDRSGHRSRPANLARNRERAERRRDPADGEDALRRPEPAEPRGGDQAFGQPRLRPRPDSPEPTPDFAVPTTIDDHGRRLYAVNARFGITNPGAAEFQVVQLSKPKKA